MRRDRSGADERIRSAADADFLGLGGFDPDGHQVAYRGHVRVDDPQMRMACNWLVADLPSSGEQINHIVASTNVVMDTTDAQGRTNHVTSDTAVYNLSVQDGATNEIVTWSGHAKLENAQMVMTAEPIIMNRVTGEITVTNEQITFRSSVIGLNPKTNAPAANPNQPIAPKTNLPPATIEDVDKNGHTESEQDF